MDRTNVSKYREHGKGCVFSYKNVFYYRIKAGGFSKKFTLKAKNYEDATVEADRLFSRYAILNEAKTKEEIALFVGKTKGIFLSQPSDLDLQTGFTRFVKSPHCPDCSPQQMNLKKRIWDLFCRFCKKNKVFSVSEVTCDLLISFRKELLNSVRSNSANKYIGMVKQILFILGIPREKFAFVKKLPVEINSMCFFDEAELYSVFRAIDGDMPLKITFRDEMKVLFRILAWSGLRLKDACLLEWKKIDLTNKVLHTRPYKTLHSSNEMVVIPLHSDLFCIFKRLLSSKAGYSKYVIPNVAKRYLKNPSGIQKDIARTIDWSLWSELDKSDIRYRPPKAGKYGAHSFRHTFATFLLNNGIDAEVIMKLLGQKSLSVTRVYMHLRPETAKRVISALPSLEH